MAQADQIVQNDTFPAFRADLNNNLAALFSDNSGTVAPTPTVAFMDWIDTSGVTPIWRKRNAANNAWITIGTLASGGFDTGGFPTGTAMLFQQTSAPTGWTKSTTHDNKALRVVSGTAGSGGSVNFITAFNSSGTVGATTLTTAQIPSHNHSTIRSGTLNSGQPPKFQVANAFDGAAFTAMNDTGGGGSHTHSISFDVAYVDLIIATKN
jgi:hypothetical protein